MMMMMTSVMTLVDADNLDQAEGLRALSAPKY